MHTTGVNKSVYVYIGMLGDIQLGLINLEVSLYRININNRFY